MPRGRLTDIAVKSAKPGPKPYKMTDKGDDIMNLSLARDDLSTKSGQLHNQ